MSSEASILTCSYEFADTRCLDNRPHWYRLIKRNEPRSGSVTPTNRSFSSNPGPDNGSGNRSSGAGHGGGGGNGGMQSHRSGDHQRGTAKDSSRQPRSTGQRHRKREDASELSSPSHYSSADESVPDPVPVTQVSVAVLLASL